MIPIVSNRLKGISNCIGNPGTGSWSRPESVESIRHVFTGKVREETRLNQASIEVLSLVAYQPGITAGECTDNADATAFVAQSNGPPAIESK